MQFVSPGEVKEYRVLVNLDLLIVQTNIEQLGLTLATTTTQPVRRGLVSSHLSRDHNQRTLHTVLAVARGYINRIVRWCSTCAGEGAVATCGTNVKLSMWVCTGAS